MWYFSWRLTDLSNHGPGCPSTLPHRRKQAVLRSGSVITPGNGLNILREHWACQTCVGSHCNCNLTFTEIRTLWKEFLHFTCGKGQKARSAGEDNSEMWRHQKLQWMSSSAYSCLSYDVKKKMFEEEVRDLMSPTSEFCPLFITVVLKRRSGRPHRSKFWIGACPLPQYR